jgi:competence protein ComGC
MPFPHDYNSGGDRAICRAFTVIESVVMLLVLSVFTLILIGLLIRESVPLEQPGSGEVDSLLTEPSP